MMDNNTNINNDDNLSLPHISHYSEDEEDEKSQLIQRNNNQNVNTVADLTFASDLKTHTKTEEDLKTLPSKIRDYYKHQNSIIAGLIEMEELVDHHDRETLDTNDVQLHRQKLKKMKYAVKISFLVNIILLVFKILASISSGSLAVIASALDSMLDVLSGSMLYFLSRAVTKQDPYKYPVSKSRLEPLGIIVFAAIMGMTSLHILEDGIEDLTHGIQGNPRQIHLSMFTIYVLLTTIVSKLALYIYCIGLRKTSAVVGALADDHRNDTFTNSLGMISALLTYEFKSLWYMDAVGAIILSLYIIINWILSGKDQIELLVGKSAPPEIIGRLAYLAAHHSRKILRVDKVIAYHFGARYYAEVDIVLPANMPLKETHDIGESLEQKIEKLTFVERAFVHNDYNFTHQPEHKVNL